MTKAESGGVKMSERLLEFAQPLIELMECREDGPELGAALRMSVVLWNACVIERSGHGPGAVAQAIEAAGSGGMPREIADVLRAMCDNALARQEFDSRLILDIDLVRGSGGDLRVAVKGAAIEDVDASRIAAEFTKLAQTTRARAEGAASDARGSASGRARGHSKASENRPAARSSGAAAGVSPWRELYTVAKGVHELAPWNWLFDADVFGVRVAGDDATYWCSVMGAAGEFYGIGLYRGDAAFDVFRALQSGADADAGMCGFDGYLISFVDRDVLDALDVQHIKASGVQFRGRSAWPQIEDVIYGRLPRPIRAESAARVQSLLEVVHEGAHRMGLDDTLRASGLDGDLPLFELRNGVVTLRRERPKRVAARAYPSVDQLGVTRLTASAKRESSTFEYDAFATRARVGDDDGWEFAPTAFLAVDATSGRVLQPRMDMPENRFEVCAAKLLEILSASGVIPRELHVRRPWIAEALKPTATALGVKLTLRQQLPSLEYVRNTIPNM